ncbi:MAG: hypothetical protein IPL78_23135 [Chloroflexi bacterium]|nr:hypothetical protein [Chloroflexota bacterium]
MTYLARVTQSGTFNALPVELSAMYDAATWGVQPVTSYSFGHITRSRSKDITFFIQFVIRGVIMSIWTPVVLNTNLYRN